MYNLRFTGVPERLLTKWGKASVAGRKPSNSK